MRIVKERFVTICQQLLAFGVVLAVLTPAAGVVSLDIVGDDHSAVGTAAASTVSATVPTGVVDSSVTEVPLTNVDGDTAALAGRTVLGASLSSSRVTSRPRAVSGYAAVGVTWQAGQDFDEGQIDLRVRTRTGEVWSDWQELEYHDEHGPDAGSAEARTARPGTEPMFVGEVDDVQIKAHTDGTPLPADLSAALITPGNPAETSSEHPSLEGAGPLDGAGQGDQDGDFSVQDDDQALSLRAASRTIAQPTIFSRAQWGANEKLRGQGQPSYGSISAGFVHHTVNANNYTEDEVPGIIRSIYAYHVQSRGWSDIGYNFLVDRFGRIWEGRYGGVDKPVIGAHTLNYNQYSFAMSAIGNYETTKPSDAMLRAYGQLFAWKLSLHGVNPASTSQRVGSSTFQAINGHRDAGSTACPGKHLYAQLPLIRTYASQAAPAGPTPIKLENPTLQTNLMGTAHPDLVVRRASDGRALIIPTGGLSSFGTRTTVGKRAWTRKADVVVTPDVTGDGQVDILTAAKSGVAKVRPGKGSGRFAKAIRTVKTMRGHTLLAGVGDVNGDARNDLVARHQGRLVLFAGTSKGGFSRTVLDKGLGRAVQLIGPGDLNADAKPDLLVRTKKNLLVRFGTGAGTFTAPQRVAGDWGGYNRIVGGGDYTGDAIADLVARRGNGQVFVVPGRGDGSFATALGPAANMKKVRFLGAGGQLAAGPGGDLLGVTSRGLTLAINRDTFDLGAPVDTGVSFAGMDAVLNAGDVNRDGLGDVLTRSTGGELMLFTGNGQGGLNPAVSLGGGWNAVTDLKAVGDVTGDGIGDLTGVLNGRLTVWPGANGTFPTSAPVAGRVPTRAGLPTDLTGFDWVLGVSDMQLKGPSDFITRERTTGRLLYYNGRETGTSNPRVIGEGMGAFDLAG